MGHTATKLYGDLSTCLVSMYIGKYRVTRLVKCGACTHDRMRQIVNTSMRLCASRSAYGGFGLHTRDMYVICTYTAHAPSFSYSPVPLAKLEQNESKNGRQQERYITLQIRLQRWQHAAVTSNPWPPPIGMRMRSFRPNRTNNGAPYVSAYNM